MAKSKLNFGAVTPQKAKECAKAAIACRRPIFLWGPPGIGKSDLIAQIGKETNREVIDIRLALWEPTDIKGIPYYSPESQKMVWAAPLELPSDPKSKAIIFLDELNSAPPAVQAAAYQLILDRKVGTYTLPEGVDIVAAGNGAGQRAITYAMPAPLANRFLHVELEVGFQDWHDWAIDNKVHSEILGYLNYSKHDLHDFNPKENKSKAFATPRSWSFVSTLLEDTSLDEGVVATLVCGAIGDGIGAKFMSHRKYASELEKPSDILDGKIDTLKVKEISAHYSLIVSLVSELKFRKDSGVEDWNSMANRFFKYILKHFEAELAVTGMQLATQSNIQFDISKLPAFNEFYEKFGDAIYKATRSSS